MPFVRIGEHRMNMHPIKDDERCEPLRESDVQAADGPESIFVSSIGNAEVGRNGQVSLAPEILACCRIETLAGWRPDPIGTAGVFFVSGTASQFRIGLAFSSVERGLNSMPACSRGIRRYVRVVRSCARRTAPGMTLPARVHRFPL